MDKLTRRFGKQERYPADIIEDFNDIIEKLIQKAVANKEYGWAFTLQRQYV